MDDGTAPQLQALLHWRDHLDVIILLDMRGKGRPMCETHFAKELLTWDISETTPATDSGGRVRAGGVCVLTWKALKVE